MDYNIAQFENVWVSDRISLKISKNSFWQHRTGLQTCFPSCLLLIKFHATNLREHLINGCDTMGLRKYTARVLFSVAIHTTKEKNDFRHLNEHADHEPYNN